MTMTRSPVRQLTGLPHDNLPADLIWYPLGANLVSAVSGMPTLVATGGGALSASGYTLPTNNTAGYLNSTNSSALDAVLGLQSATTGAQLIIAMQCIWGTQDGNGTPFIYGNIGGASCIGLRLNDNDPTVNPPNFFYRSFATTPPALSTTQMTLASGSNVTGAGAGLVAVVVEVRMISATNADIFCSMNRSGTSAEYTLANQDLTQAGGGTKPGNQSGAHNGLTLGARWNAGGTATEHFLGAGASHTASVSNFQARKWASTDTGRRAAVLADLLARPQDLSPTLRA